MVEWLLHFQNINDQQHAVHPKYYHRVKSTQQMLYDILKARGQVSRWKSLRTQYRSYMNQEKVSNDKYPQEQIKRKCVELAV